MNIFKKSSGVYAFNNQEQSGSGSNSSGSWEGALHWLKSLFVRSNGATETSDWTPDWSAKECPSFEHPAFKQQMSSVSLISARKLPLDIPDEPTNVALCISGQSALHITFNPPSKCKKSDITGYKVEWSEFEDFAPLSGSEILRNPSSLHHEITNLTPGRVYYVRLSAGNVHGFGAPEPSTPSCAIPSNWKELNGAKSRFEGKDQLLDDLFENLQNSPDSGSIEFMDVSPTRKLNVRSTLKSIFSAAPKFQKHLRGGIYLAALLHHDSRIIVSGVDGTIPILEIDSDYSTQALQSNLQWMAKVSCMWQDVKHLQSELAKTSESCAAKQFRIKFLATVNQLQLFLGIRDLGQLYYQPIKDQESGSMIIVVVRSLDDVKTLNTAHVKWMSLTKLQRRLIGTKSFMSRDESGDGGEAGGDGGGSYAEKMITEQDARVQQPGAINHLISSTVDMIAFQYLSSLRLPKGLYLGYLKLSCSIEKISLRTHKHQPNVLPNVKVRSNNNVSREEWAWLTRQKDNDTEHVTPTDSQLLFHNQIVNSCEQLFNELGVSKTAAETHRLYDLEVVDIGHGVSFILVLPPLNEVCSAPGHTTDNLRPKVPFKTLPVNVFEILHQKAYHPDLVRRFSHLSCHLDARIQHATQQLRQAFTNEDSNTNKARVATCTGLLQQVEDGYRETRWIIDVIANARDKTMCCGPVISTLYSNLRRAAANALMRSDVVATNNDSNEFHLPRDHHTSETNSVAIECGDSGCGSSLDSGRQRILETYV